MSLAMGWVIWVIFFMQDFIWGPFENTSSYFHFILVDQIPPKLFGHPKNLKIVSNFMKLYDERYYEYMMNL